MGSEPQAAKADPKTELELLREEVANFKSWGIIEIAVRNPNVSEYMQHWEGRATKAEAELATLQQRVDELTREVEKWKARAGANFADSCKQADRAEAAEARLSEATRLAVEALEPFAKHLDEMRFDLDHEGRQLPDEQTVGWVYVTNGDFRRARAALTRLTTLSDRKTEGGAK